MPPETHYARNGRTNLAYSISGEGTIDVLFVPGSTSHLEQLWEEPGMASFFERLGSFARVMIMDRRGVGLSDPLDGSVTLDDEVEDVAAVLEAAGSERVVLLGYASGGIPCIRLARRRPERVRALVLYAGMASARARVDYDWARSAEELEPAIEELVAGWGTGANIDVVAPSQSADPRMRSWMARMERLASSPGAMRLILEVISRYDAREDLAHLRVPTLIMHRAGDQLIDVRHSRYMARAHPGRALRRARGRRQPAERRRLGGGARRDRGVPHRRAVAIDRARAADRAVHRHRRLHRPRARGSATSSGATCSPPTTRRCAASSTASAGWRSRRSATPSSPPSPARRPARCARRGRSPTSSTTSG